MVELVYCLTNLLFFDITLFYCINPKIIHNLLPHIFGISIDLVFLSDLQVEAGKSVSKLFCAKFFRTLSAIFKVVLHASVHADCFALSLFLAVFTA